MQNGGTRMRELRESRELSQAALAEAVGITHSMVSRLESDDPQRRRAPSWDVLLRLADVLKVTQDDLAFCFGIVPPDLAHRLTTDSDAVRRVREELAI